jgi:hypothetical protein
VLPIKTYEEFENDPMSALISSFSKLDTKGEGASVQIIILPESTIASERVQRVHKELGKGTKYKEALEKTDDSIAGSLKKLGKDVAKDLFTKKEVGDKDEKEDLENTTVESELVDTKSKGSIHPCNIRVLTSAKTKERSEEILEEITTIFNIYSKPRGNSLSWKKVKKTNLRSFAKDFIFRRFNSKNSFYLGNHEIATLYHFPASQEHTSHLKQSQATTSPAPFGMSSTGIQIGTNSHRGKETPVFISKEDRMRHIYTIGQTGVGKTGILMNMIAQDIKNGEGVCYVDPHGVDINTILSFIPPERYNDVIYFDPAHTTRPMALNMLEFDPAYPEQKTLIIDELMGIFNQLFDMQAQGGAMFQQYFKNSAFLVMDHPESGNTLLEITRVLSDKKFRDMKLSYCKNPIVKQFWVSAEQTQGEQSLANFVPYISSKFDPLISNELLRPVIVQEKSSFNVREVMDNKKILLVNLSKGRLGELNANLLGLILVGKIQMAALSRADSTEKQYPDFFLYIDEFQSFTTPSIASILSEARKYRLSLNVAHQFLGQLEDTIKNAVMGNVGNMAVFRVSPEDAKELEPRFDPLITANDMIEQENRNAYVSMLVNGQPVKPFNIKTDDYPSAKNEQIEKLKELSFFTYGRPREEIEQEIIARYTQ